MTLKKFEMHCFRRINASAGVKKSMSFCASFSNPMKSGILPFVVMNSKSDFCGAMARAKVYKLDRLVGIFVSQLPCCKALGKSLSFSAGQFLPFEKDSGDVRR